MTHTVIVPGVGGSEHQHWQSWLQRQLVSSSRVEQKNWDRPVLSEWIEQFVNTVQAVQTPVQIVAHSLTDYKDYFHQLKINVPATLLISENDPWLDFFDALQLAKSWQLTPINLGQVGHINVASGFGPFPDLLNHLLPEDSMCSHSSIDPVKTHFSLKFA